MIRPLDNTADMSSPQLIKHYDYPALTYEFVAEDGYKTTLHRIPAT